MHAPFPSLAAIEIAIVGTMREAQALGIELQTIQLATTSEIWDEKLVVLFVYETDQHLRARDIDETHKWLKNQFEEELQKSQKTLPFERMPDQIFYEFDSHENIKKNFNGSYYLRLK